MKFEELKEGIKIVSNGWDDETMVAFKNDYITILVTDDGALVYSKKEFEDDFGGYEIFSVDKQKEEEAVKLLEKCGRIKNGKIID